MYNIILTGHFKKQLKRLVKKDPHLKKNLKEALLAFRRDTAISIGLPVMVNEKDNLTYEELTEHLRATKSELSK